MDLWLMIQTLVEACAPIRASATLRTSAQYQSSLVSGAISYLEKRFESDQNVVFGVVQSLEFYYIFIAYNVNIVTIT